MIDDKTKQKLLKELEKNGNIWASCLKINIHRSTFYRWRETDKAFNKQAAKALRQGRDNCCDIAFNALMLNVKDKKMDAIKYTLGHLDPRFKHKPNNEYIFKHVKDTASDKAPLTLEDILDNYDKFFPTLDGSDSGTSEPGKQINWATREPINSITGTGDSTSATDKPPEDPQEKKTI